MSKRRLYYIIFVIFSIVYIIGTLTAPIAPNRFNLSASKTHLLQLTIALPVVLIWLAAVFGAERFKSYSSAIRNHPDGKGLDKMATGLTLLVVSVVIINGLAGILRAWAREGGWIEGYTIISNYLSVLIPLVAYYFMYAGSAELVKYTKVKKKNNQNHLVAGAILFIIAAIYTTVVFSYEYRNATPDPAQYRSFYMNDTAILFTLIIPYLVSWWLGIMAALNLNLYLNKVKGVIYKGALFRLVVGTLLVVAFGVLLQMFIALSTYLANTNLRELLLIVYALIIFYAAGFLVIASGAKKLSRIEEVK